MYQVLAHFQYQHFEQDPVLLINQVMNQWYYNGQTIGREMSVTYHQNAFQVRLSTPEQDSLLSKFNSPLVEEALQQAAEGGVELTFFEVVGRDYQAVETSKISQPTFQILYTTHLDTCSPVYDGDSFSPIPLYKLASPTLSKQLLHWQEARQACDSLQMNGSVLEQEALLQISEVNSPLSQQGRALCEAITQQTRIPTYYYLYRLGKDVATEHSRSCPHCGGQWKLNTPLHEIFWFKCDRCYLISNLSWEVM